MSLFPTHHNSLNGRKDSEHCDQESQLEIVRRHQAASSWIAIELIEISSAIRGRNLRGGLLREHEQRDAIAAARGGRHGSRER